MKVPDGRPGHGSTVDALRLLGQRHHEIRNTLQVQGEDLNLFSVAENYKFLLVGRILLLGGKPDKAVVQNFPGGSRPGSGGRNRRSRKQ